MRLEKLLKVLVAGGAALATTWVGCTPNDSTDKPNDGVAEGGAVDGVAPDGGAPPDLAVIPDLATADAEAGVGSWLSW